MSLRVVSFQENLSGPFHDIPQEDGIIRTAAEFLIIRGTWNLDDALWEEGASVTITGPNSGPDISAPVDSNWNFEIPLILPQAESKQRIFTVEITLDLPSSSTIIETIEVRTMGAAPQIEALHPRDVLLDSGRLTFTICLRVLSPARIDGSRLDAGSNRALVTILAGHSTNPMMRTYQVESTIRNPVSSSTEFMSVDLELEDVLPEGFIFLGAIVNDGWGNTSAYARTIKTHRLIQMNNPPSRLEYGQAAQDVVNYLPEWTACRLRDYLALSHDPDYTMKGASWPYLGNLSETLLPYDFRSPPVAQRIANATIGQAGESIRKTLSSFRKMHSLSASDIGATGHIYKAEIPEEEQTDRLDIPSSPSNIVSGSWETIPEASANWRIEFPMDVTTDHLTDSMSARLADLELRRGHIRTTVRVETDRFWSPGSDAQNIDTMQGSGSFGIQWRHHSGGHWRMLWGPYEQGFGIRVERVGNDAPVVLYKDSLPRYYPIGRDIIIQIIDNETEVMILIDEQVVTQIKASPPPRPWRAGLLVVPPQPAVTWKAFFSLVGLQGHYDTGIVGRTSLVGSAGVRLKKLGSLEEFLEAAPTQIELIQSDPPPSGLHEGLAVDPDRFLVEADRKRHRVLWSVEDDHIVKMENDTREPLFRYWIWDPDSRDRILTEWSLRSILIIREWLWVLGTHKRTGQHRIFFVDPSTPDPLYPESTLYCEGYADFEARGVSDLVRSEDFTQVFIR